MNNTFASNMKRLKLNDRTNNEEFDNSFDPFDRSEPLATVEKLEHPLDSKQSSESGASNRIGFFKQPSSGSIEELERSIPPPDLPILKQDFTLFISMAIHPMNLEHYIWGDNPSGESNIQIQHCFHTSICVRLLLAIISGIQYVHNQGIVHRDLKPSNIFLSVSQGPRTDYEGAIDITGCGGCPGAPPGDRKFITPHIGDFGLAAEMSTEPPPTGNTLSAKPMTLAMVSSQHTQPGTAFYIPPSTDRTICTKLDVYSLGVITFELITKFGTKSERGMVLQRLGRGEFPNNFDQHEMAEGIRGMLCSKREDRWTTGEVKKWLKGIKARHDLV
jgi:translation initiation factor 2-alpha kinase 3